MFAAGIDIGSLTAKTVIVDDRARIVGHALVLTGAMSKRAGETSFESALKVAGISSSDVTYVLATGYGRNNVPFAKAEMTEITCHARGAHHLFPETRTIIDIGGQDSKAISVNERGAATNFMMNDKCAAGSGRFLEVMARALEIELDRMGELSLQSTKEVPISSMCTVFAESEVVSLIADNQPKEVIIRGLHDSIADRILGMVNRVGIEEEVTLTGGVAKNEGVVRALEDRLGVKMFIPPEPQIIGALGAALMARELSPRHDAKDQKA